MGLKRLVTFHHAGDLTHDNLERELQSMAAQALTAEDAGRRVTLAQTMPTPAQLNNLTDGARIFVNDAGTLYIVERVGTMLLKYEVTQIT